MDVITGITLAAPAGVNAYIPLLGVAIAERAGWLQLRQPFDVLGEWWFIALLSVLLIVEVLADKFPAVDHVNDAVQTFVRPAAGGILAVSASGAAEVSPVVLVVVGVLVAGSVHAVKASARPVLNAATGGTAAPVASTAEDVGAAGITILAIAAPVLAAVLAAVVVLVAVLVIRAWKTRGRTRV